MSDRDQDPTCEPEARRIDDDLLLDLTLGLLDEETDRSVRAHLARCAVCDEALRVLVADQEHGRNRFEGRTKPARVRAPRRVRNRVWLGAAAAVTVAAVLLLVLLPTSRTGRQAVRPAFLTADIVSAELRSSDDPSRQALREGLDGYDRRDFDGAVDRLTEALSQDPTSAFTRIYLGNALCWKSDFRAAAEVLEPLDTDLIPSPWNDEARWTLLCAWHGTGEYARADSLLQFLQTREGEVGDRARQYPSE